MFGLNVQFSSSCFSLSNSYSFTLSVLAPSFDKYSNKFFNFLLFSYSTTDYLPKLCNVVYYFGDP